MKQKKKPVEVLQSAEIPSQTLIESDPDYDDNAKYIKAISKIKKPEQRYRPKKSTKVLTTPTKRSTVASTIKTKGGKMVQKTKQILSNKKTALSTFWLLELAFRVTTGLVLLNLSSNFFVIVVALYALLTAGILLVKHFFDAHN